MKKVFFTAGPSQLYPSVQAHLAAALVDQVPSISHRSRAFMDIYAATERALRELLGVPEDYIVFFLSSANEAWERIAQNCIGKKSFHLVNGSFSRRFADTVSAYQKQAEVHEVEFGQGFDSANINVPEDSELIAAIANETSAGVWTPPQVIGDLRKSYPEKLIVVDGVSAVPAYPLDLETVDALYFSVQKGFGLPAGLGVLILSPRMLGKAAMLQSQGYATGSYHSFDAMLEKAEKKQTQETPNVLAIYLLGKVAEDMLRRERALGEEIFVRAERWYEFLDALPGLDVFVKGPVYRSPYVIVASTAAGEAPRWIKALNEKGYVVGAGYGKYKPDQLRIANFPATSLADMEGLMAAITAGM